MSGTDAPMSGIDAPMSGTRIPKSSIAVHRKFKLAALLYRNDSYPTTSEVHVVETLRVCLWLPHRVMVGLRPMRTLRRTQKILIDRLLLLDFILEDCLYEI